MTPARWQQVKTTLAEALDHDTAERSDFLQQACAHDTALRREVESLLDQPDGDLDTCAENIGLVRPDVSAPGKIGRRLGAYELVREIGRGGMGAVWLAKRADQQFEKLVAIKLLKRGTDTDEVLRRFHAERQILARLDHPNIARLLDAGTTEDGLPYFVMEYVDGARVTDFIQQQGLSVRERLRLFLKICAAVQFAHQNLVVHRDLKPGNILVTPQGEPKLLDFGVAKLLAPGDDAWQLTITGGERFTPCYASPEQVRGEPITTVSDVYSLGALLYEILTGATPHRFASKTPTATQIALVICDEEPARPSTSAADPELRRQLRGDLDTILLRALAKAPERRYRGAGNLADDLQRHLDDRPVHARPDSFGYRAGKFLRRNKAGVAAAALVLLTLLGGIIATAREAQIANRERARAERRFNEVRKIANSLMFEFHNSIAELPGALAARQLVTQRAVEYLDSLAQEAGNDLSLKSELATAYTKIGGLTFDSATAIRTHEKAVALGEELVRAAPSNSAYRVQLSESYDQLSDVMKISGHSRDAIDDAQKSLAVLENLHGLDPAQLAQRYVGLSIALYDAGDFRGSLRSAQTALQLQEKSLAQSPTDKEAQRAIEHSYGLISDALADAGDYPQAIDVAKKGLALAEAIYANEPSNSRNRRDMWAMRFRLGRQLAASGDPRGALENYRPALEFLESLAKADPKDTGHQRWLALTYSAMGDAHALLDEREEALREQKKALSLSESLAGADPERIEAQQDIAKICRAIAALWMANGELETAAKYWERAVSISKNLGAADPENARVRSTLANAEADLAECDRALARQQEWTTNREQRLRTADGLRSESLQLWEELQQSGRLSAPDSIRLARFRGSRSP